MPGMQALVYDAYGPIEALELRDIPSPVAREGELVVEVRRAALNPKDALFRKGRFRLVSGRRFPKRCGLDFAGVVVESRSPHFAPGQRVFGALDEWRFTRGTLAERVVVRDSEAAPLPDAVSDEAGAAIALVGLTALQTLRDIARVRDGTRVLIHGASGGVGTVAIQVARKLGARVITTSSERNFELCARLGAERTLDYQGDVLQALDGPVEVVFDVFGNFPLERARAACRGRGTFVSTVPTPGRIVAARLTRWRAFPRRVVVVSPNRRDLALLADWVLAGTLEPIIDRRVPLGEVREAFRFLESKRARGKVVIEVA
jgi:NADPH:quinone reductase-like Zn-dependent oxidoreductase